jgi:hypothetical protein
MSNDVPVTAAEWQQAVDAAHSLLALAAARAAGRVAGGPPINLTRCAALLERGAAHGYTPHPDAIARTLAWLTIAVAVDDQPAQALARRAAAARTEKP